MRSFNRFNFFQFFVLVFVLHCAHTFILYSLSIFQSQQEEKKGWFDKCVKCENWKLLINTERTRGKNKGKVFATAAQKDSPRNTWNFSFHLPTHQKKCLYQFVHSFGLFIRNPFTLLMFHFQLFDHEQP